MPETSSSNLGVRFSPSRGLWPIMAAATALRIGAAIYQGNRVEALPGIWDQISYHELAVRVLQGHGFSFGTGWWPATAAGQPTAHWSFLYVLFLAGTYVLLGVNPMVPRLLQTVLTGILQPLLTWRIGRRLFGDRAGLLAAAFSALNVYFVYYSSALMTESLYIAAVLWVVDRAMAMADSTSETVKTRSWLILGLAMGVAVLLRQVMLLLVPVILLWVVWRRTLRSRPSGQFTWYGAVPALRSSLPAVVVLLACILPWTIRNYRVYGRFVLLNTNAGFAFFWANHPIHGSNFIPILGTDQPSYSALIPTELRTFSEADIDRALLRRGLAFVRTDPARYLRLSASRTKEYFRFWPTSSSSQLSNCARTLSFGLWLPFLTVGVLLAAFARQRLPGYREEAAASMHFVLLLSFLYTLVHLLSWTLVRYRLPVDAITVPFGAVAVLLLYDQAAAALRTSRILKQNAPA